MISNRWKIIAAALPIIGTLALAQPQPGGLGGFFSAWIAGTPKIFGPDDYIHFWNPASLDETDQGTGSNDATSFNFDPDAFDGWNMGTADNKYVLTSTNIVNGTNYTITAWVKPDKAAMNLNDFGGWVVNERDAGGNFQTDFQLLYSKSSGAWSFSAAYPAANLQLSTLNTNVKDNTWQHLAGIVQGGSGGSAYVQLFVDGVSTGKNQYAFTFIPGDVSVKPFAIGTENFLSAGGGAQTKFHGSIGKVRFYNRVLTDQEILDEIAADGYTGP